MASCKVNQHYKGSVSKMQVPIAKEAPSKTITLTANCCSPPFFDGNRLSKFLPFSALPDLCAGCSRAGRQGLIASGTIGLPVACCVHVVLPDENEREACSSSSGMKACLKA